MYEDIPEQRKRRIHGGGGGVGTPGSKRRKEVQDSSKGLQRREKHTHVSQFERTSLVPWLYKTRFTKGRNGQN